jgi:hypothetical protein
MKEPTTEGVSLSYHDWLQRKFSGGDSIGPLLKRGEPQTPLRAASSKEATGPKRKISD